MRRLVAVLEALDHLPLREAVLRQELAALQQHAADFQVLDRLLVDLHFAPVAGRAGHELEHGFVTPSPDIRFGSPLTCPYFVIPQLNKGLGANTSAVRFAD